MVTWELQNMYSSSSTFPVLLSLLIIMLHTILAMHNQSNNFLVTKLCSIGILNFAHVSIHFNCKSRHQHKFPRIIVLSHVFGYILHYEHQGIEGVWSNFGIFSNENVDDGFPPKFIQSQTEITTRPIRNMTAIRKLSLLCEINKTTSEISASDTFSSYNHQKMSYFEKKKQQTKEGFLWRKKQWKI